MNPTKTKNTFDRLSEWGEKGYESDLKIPEAEFRCLQKYAESKGVYANGDVIKFGSAQVRMMR
tara:strand:- start:20483 stop:20671 length:189 start_codon:yes stop_codon:yes gene_type:complete